MYGSVITAYQVLGVISKEDLMSTEIEPRLRIFSYQWFARALLLLGFIRCATVNAYLIGKRNMWFNFFYTQIMLGTASICYETMRKRGKIISIVRQLEANAKPKERKVVTFLATGCCVILFIYQILRNLVYVLIWMSGSEFDNFINRFWFDSAAIYPLWVKLIFAVFELAVKFLVMSIAFISLPLFLITIYNAVLQFENLRDDIQDRLLENETTMTTTAEMVEFRRRFANIVRVIQMINEVSSTLMTTLCAQLGIFVVTFILIILRGQTMKNTQTEAFESIGLILLVFVIVAAFGHTVFCLDSRELHPITTIRKLSAYHAVDDEDFFNQSEGLVHQMIYCPRITFSHFFDLDRKAIISIVGVIWTYFMSMMSIDKAVHAQVMSIVQPTDEIKDQE